MSLLIQTFFNQTLLDENYLYKDINEAIINVSGFVQNDDIEAVFRDDSWGANKYRAIAADRSTLTGGRLVTAMYESSDAEIWSKTGVVFDIVTNPYTVMKDVLKVGSTYYGLYFGPQGFVPNPPGNNGERIGLATSSDLITWVDQGWILTPKTSPVPSDVTRLFPSYFLFHNGEYWLGIDESKNTTVYEATGTIALYKSTDLITFTRQGIIIDTGNVGTWDEKGVFQSAVFFTNDVFNMYYAGTNEAEERKIGFAHSSDGINFTKYANNPILFDDQIIGEPVTFFDNDSTFHFWYRYYNGGTAWACRKGIVQ